MTTEEIRQALCIPAEVPITLKAVLLAVSHLAWDALFGQTKEGSAIKKLISTVRGLLNRTSKETDMPEKKPYDLAALVAKLKAVGIDATEELAKKMVEEIFGWIDESARASTIPYDDLALIVLPKVKDFVLAQVDKIDGQAG